VLNENILPLLANTVVSFKFTFIKIVLNVQNCAALTNHFTK